MILHVDMDAFYASVEIRDRPALLGKPVIVGGAADARGVVAAANYEARKYGVHSAMPTARATKLCPDAIILRPRMEHYAEVSRQIREIFHSFTPLVEPLSLDEAFLDATGSQSLFGSPVEIGWLIKRKICDQLQLVASVGVAPNKFLAKVASDLEKPDGFVVVDPDRVRQFLDPLLVRRLWGVGRVTEQTLKRLGATTVRDVRCLPLDLLKQHFGAQGEHLWRLSRGIDHRGVTPDREAKSVSHETTFSVDVDDPEVLRAWVVDLSEQVARRLRRQKLRGRTVQLKVRFSDFSTITRSTTLPSPTNGTREIWEAANDMLQHRLPKKGLAIRLVGVGVSGFDTSGHTQRSLFDEQEQEARANLDQTTDQIREKFGAASLSRGSGLLHKNKVGQRPKSDDEGSVE